MELTDLHKDRRRFMKMMAAAAGTPMMGNLMQAAYAAGPFNDYKALVCVFLFGGNDSQNMVIPLGGEYAGYASGRGNLALPSENVLPISAGISGRSFGMHPAMPGLANIFNTDRKLAIASNVGVLLKPTTKAQYQAKDTLPPQLFSHSDMQSHWQTGRADAPAEQVRAGADLIESPVAAIGFGINQRSRPEFAAKRQQHRRIRRFRLEQHTKRHRAPAAFVSRLGQLLSLPPRPPVGICRSIERGASQCAGRSMGRHRFACLDHRRVCHQHAVQR